MKFKEVFIWMIHWHSTKGRTSLQILTVFLRGASSARRQLRNLCKRENNEGIYVGEEKEMF